MKDEVVERVACVFIEHLLSRQATDKEWQDARAAPEWPKALAGARAAINAVLDVLMEPSEGMLAAGRVHLVHEYIWEKMITQARKEITDAD